MFFCITLECLEVISFISCTAKKLSFDCLITKENHKTKPRIHYGIKHTAFSANSVESHEIKLVNCTSTITSVK